MTDKSYRRPPGLYVQTKPLDVTDARQLIEHHVASTAVHSKSRGWLPSVLMTLSHVPLIGPGQIQELKLMVRRDELEPLIAVLQEVLEAADWDAAAGPIEGNPDKEHS